jgi:lauroyl/myristoyl acyltransferase
MSAARPPEPVLLARDLGGLLLYGPGQALVSAMPRPWLRPLASLGSALKARLLAEEQEAREELRLLFGAQPRPRL